MKTAHAELLQVLAELSAVFPDWRFGQLVANVAAAARGPQVEAIWDSEDEELLAAARRLLERNRGRAQVPALRAFGKNDAIGMAAAHLCFGE